MIFFDSSNGKGTLAIIGSLLVMSFIFSMWLKTDPFSEATEQNSFWLDIGQESAQTFNDVKNSFGLGMDKSKEVVDEVAKEIKKQQIVAETKKYLENKEEGQVLIATEEECVVKGGLWESTQSFCNFQTTDAGTECSDSEQCQGWCLANDDTRDELLEQGQPIAATGSCSEMQNVYGCVLEVEQGQVKAIICID